MRITISERLHPFSHDPGATCLLPGSSLCLQIFPARIRLFDLASPLPTPLGEILFGIEGPVKDFTVIQDLEQCEVRVFGTAASGYFSYEYHGMEGGMEGGMALNIERGHLPILAMPDGVALGKAEKVACAFERLSLGSHKAQDWGLMQRRQKLEEIFPLWFALGQLTPCKGSVKEGTGLFLERCREVIAGDRREILPAFRDLFLAGFSGMLVPRLEDEQFQGFNLPPLKEKVSPLFLLTKGAALIRELFIREEGSEISVLPALPPEFHSGRLTGIRCSPYGRLDMEWSKKQIRRLILHAEGEGQVRLCFEKELKDYRIRTGTKSSGQRVVCGSLVAIERGKQYLLDNFQR